MLHSNNAPDDGGNLIEFLSEHAPLVSILIPTTNQAGLLSSCLKSISRNISSNISYEIIVVLNAATDEVKAFLQNQTRGVNMAESPVNLGVAGGYNRARSLARGKYLMLLHDDTEVEPLWLESLIETAEKRPDAGVFASAVYFPDGALQALGAILCNDGLTTCIDESHNCSTERRSQIRPIDYSGTCSLLVRSEIWDVIGGLDENLYPAYYVDVDLCMAVRKHGLAVLLEPRSRLFHHRGASSSLLRRQFASEKNRALFCDKWKEELRHYLPSGSVDPLTLENSILCTEKIASELRVPEKRASGTPLGNPQIDALLQEARHFEMERACQKSYVQFLETQHEVLSVKNLKFSKSLQEAKQARAISKQKNTEKRSQVAGVKERWWRRLTKMLSKKSL